MNLISLLNLLSGIALFLFGMTLMGDSLKAVAGSKLQVILYKLAGTTPMAILLGTGVTAIIQSSSATSVMVVGFVNSGIMQVQSGIGVILGAILGTSVTGWVLCLGNIGKSGIASVFNTSNLTSIVAVIGIIPYFFLKKKKQNRDFGSILIGFAVLMYGMSIMSEAVSPLRDSKVFIDLITNFSNPIVGIFVGLVFTAIIQSASASVGILQALAITGIITFDIAFPMIVGIGIGAALPVILSSLGASPRGKQTAFSYLIINTFFGCIIAIVYYVLRLVIQFDFSNRILTMVSIALINSIYRLIIVIIAAPFIKFIAKTLSSHFPDDRSTIDEEDDFSRLDERFLANPAIAIEQCHAVSSSMARRALENLHDAFSLFELYSDSVFDNIYKIEDSIDRYEDKLGTYLMKVTSCALTEKQAEQTSKYLHAIVDFERIGDHAMNIAETMKKMNEKKVSFSKEAKREAETLIRATHDISTLASECFLSDDKTRATRVEPLEELIDEICDKMKFDHVERLNQGICNLDQGFPFLDLITDCERISDHCSNIAIALIELANDNLNSHEYALTLKEKQSEEFSKYYNEYAKIYKI